MLIEAGVVANDENYLAARAFSFMGKVTTSASKWRLDASVTLWPLVPEGVLLPAAWHADGDDYVIVLF